MQTAKPESRIYSVLSPQSSALLKHSASEESQMSSVPPVVGEAEALPQTAVAPARVGRYRWVICALLFFATTINYVDRVVMGILAKDLQTIIGWTELDYGNIVAAFNAA